MIRTKKDNHLEEIRQEQKEFLDNIEKRGQLKAKQEFKDWIANLVILAYHKARNNDTEFKPIQFLVEELIRKIKEIEKELKELDAVQ